MPETNNFVCCTARPVFLAARLLPLLASTRLLSSASPSPPLTCTSYLHPPVLAYTLSLAPE
eukprot:753671-Hanusia_phi.AAC.3